MMKSLDANSLMAYQSQSLIVPLRSILLPRSAYAVKPAIRWAGREYRSLIVNISSIAARTGAPNEDVAYAATKAALETFTLGLAGELASSRIYVNAVAPGTIDTTIHARAGGKRKVLDQR